MTMRRLQMNALTQDEGGVMLAALREWCRFDADPVAEALHDRLAECAEIFVAEYKGQSETQTD